MRKARGLLLLIATLTVMTTACGTSENETMRRIYDVNQAEAILQRHETFRLCGWDYGWDNMREDYVTRESIYSETSSRKPDLIRRDFSTRRETMVCFRAWMVIFRKPMIMKNG